jgi:C4-dicarboxylate-specific signal transduction histidine kinase
VTAGATHEFLNVLAIINEASGLLQDMLNLRRGQLSSWDEKARTSLARVRIQVERGTELSECLNGFAHSLPAPEARVEIDEVLDRLAVLMRHTARLKRVVLQTEPAHPSPVVVVNPLHLQIVLAAFIEWCLDLTGPGGTITLRALELDEVIAVRVTAAPPRADAAEGDAGRQRLARFDGLIDGLRVSVVGEHAGRVATVELHLPRR